MKTYSLGSPLSWMPGAVALFLLILNFYLDFFLENSRLGFPPGRRTPHPPMHATVCRVAVSFCKEQDLSDLFGRLIA